MIENYMKKFKSLTMKANAYSITDFDCLFNEFSFLLNREHQDNNKRLTTWYREKLL